MIKKKMDIQILATSIVILLVIVSVSGCVSNQNASLNTSGDLGKFTGTWTGSLAMSTFGGRINASISQLTFQDDSVEVTTSSERGSYSMNYTYSVNGNNLVLQPKFTGRGEFPGGQLPNGTRPPNGQFPRNGTRGYNGTSPPNGTRQYNRTWNGTQPPGGNPPSMNLSFEYSFNEQNDILYLNGAQFIKIQ